MLTQTRAAGTDSIKLGDKALDRRQALWVLIVAFCTIGMGYLPFAYLTFMGHVTYFYLILLVVGAAGSVTLLRVAGAPERSRARTVSRILISYLLFELLAVIPVAVWLGTTTVNQVLGAVSVRFTWLLFPVMLVVCGNDRTRRIAGIIVVAAAACLAAWAAVSALTGGGGYYVEEGVVRWRALALGGGGLVLFAWPCVLAASRAVPNKYVAPLLGISAVGLALTNSRSGFIAFAVAGVACVALSGQIRKLIVWAVPAALAAVVVALLGTASGPFGYTLSHLFDITSGNGADRLMRWRLAWNFFVAHPINDYVWTWRYYLVYVSDLYQPHNFALEVAITEGLAGLIFYGSVLTTPLRRAWKWVRLDPQARALVGYLIAYLVFSFQNADWYLPVTMPLLVAAVAGLVARLDQLDIAEAALPDVGAIPAA